MWPFTLATHTYTYKLPLSGHQAILPLPVAPLDVVNAQWLRHMPAMLVVSTFGGLWGALFNWSRMVLWRRTRRTHAHSDLVSSKCQWV